MLDQLPHPWLVIEDSAHVYETTHAVLEFFHPRLEAGDYIVVEDGVVKFLPDPYYRTFQDGPNRALEDFLAAHVEMNPPPATALHEKAAGEVYDQRRSAAAMASLAEGIQSLVSHMRTEQQQIRDWVNAQTTLQDDIRKLLRRLTSERETR